MMSSRPGNSGVSAGCGGACASFGGSGGAGCRDGGDSMNSIDPSFVLIMVPSENVVYVVVSPPGWGYVTVVVVPPGPFSVVVVVESVVPRESLWVLVVIVEPPGPTSVVVVIVAPKRSFRVAVVVVTGVRSGRVSDFTVVPGRVVVWGPRRRTSPTSSVMPSARVVVLVSSVGIR